MELNSASLLVCLAPVCVLCWFALCSLHRLEDELRKIRDEIRYFCYCTEYRKANVVTEYGSDGADDDGE